MVKEKPSKSVYFGWIVQETWWLDGCRCDFWDLWEQWRSVARWKIWNRAEILPFNLSLFCWKVGLIQSSQKQRSWRFMQCCPHKVHCYHVKISTEICTKKEREREISDNVITMTLINAWYFEKLGNQADNYLDRFILIILIVFVLFPDPMPQNPEKELVLMKRAPQESFHSFVKYMQLMEKIFVKSQGKSIYPT